MSSGAGYGGGVETRVAELERKARAWDASLAALTALSGSVGYINSMGTVSLATGAATTTTKTDAAIASTSLIYLAPTSTGSWSVDAGISAVTPTAGQFVVTHTASALTRTFNYIAITPV